MNILSKRIEENENQYLWRVDGYIREGKYQNWKEVIDIVNKELFGNEEDEYYGESAPRKRMKYARDVYETVFIHMSEDEYIKKLEDTIRELEVEKVKFRDQRNAWQAQNRSIARHDDNMKLISDAILSIRESDTEYDYSPIVTNGEDELLICVSDFHMGQTNQSYFGNFDSDIAKQRLHEYFEEICKIAETHKASTVNVALLGDLINNRNLHMTLRMEDRENVTQQLHLAARAIYDFVKALGSKFENVKIADVAGNHSRLGKKDECVRGERLDNTIIWFIEQMLEDRKELENIKIVNAKYDDTIGKINILGKEYLLVHGDFDKMDKVGIANLTMMLGHLPEVILFGHYHECEYKKIGRTQMIRSGAFAGTGNNHCIQSRIYGEPSQAVCICNKKGVKTFYPITFSQIA